jgi:hypothetical protein
MVSAITRISADLAHARAGAADEAGVAGEAAAAPT